MDSTNIEAVLGMYFIDGKKCRTAYVLDGQPPRQTDVWFRHCEFNGKEFVVLRFGTKDTRVFIPATTSKQIQDYLGDPSEG